MDAEQNLCCHQLGSKFRHSFRKTTSPNIVPNLYTYIIQYIYIYTVCICIYIMYIFFWLFLAGVFFPPYHDDFRHPNVPHLILQDLSRKNPVVYGMRKKPKRQAWGGFFRHDFFFASDLQGGQIEHIFLDIRSWWFRNPAFTSWGW